MKILFVNQKPFNNPSGAERSAINVAVGLSKIGHQVECLYCGDETRTDSWKIEGQSITAHSVKSDSIHSEFELSQSARDLLSWLQNHNLSSYDVIHSHNSAGHIAVGKLENQDVTKVGTVRDYKWLCEGDAMCHTTGNDFNSCTDLDCCDSLIAETRCSSRLSNRGRYFMPIRLVRTAYRQSIQQRIKNGLSDIDHVISISKLIKNILVSNTSLSTTDVTTIYNSVLLDSYPEPQSNTNNELLFVGSLKPQKGILEAIKSFSLISDRIQEYELIVAGDGRLRSDAEDLVAEFSLSRRVRFVGHVDRDTILQLYSQASVVLYPSVWPEPFGRVSIEAMASGTPIVGSKFGAIPEVLDDWPSSRIADPTDNEQFSQEILQVLDSDHAPKKLSKESVYSHLIAADKHEKLYVELNQ